MSDTSTDSRQRLKLVALAALVLAMTLTVAGSLWLVLKQARHLALPSLHGELWLAYQVNSEMGHLSDSARRLLREEEQADDLVARVQVLRSLTQQLEGHHLFDFMPESRPTAEATLQRVIDLSQQWDDRAAWGDASGARQIASEVVQQLTPLRAPMHEVMVATNISLANELDYDRQRLHGYFTTLGWALAGLLLGVALLVMHLIGNYRRARGLSRRLSQLNQTLEARVAERTTELVEGQALLNFVLEASPSDVALVSSDGKQTHFVNRRLLQRLNLKKTSEFSLMQLFRDAEESQQFRDALQARQRVDSWEGMLAGNTPYWGVVSGRLLEYRGQPTQLVWSYDISLRKQMEQELLVLATTDALTGLNNRHAFIQRASELLKNAERFDQPCTLLMLDVDHFKAINDHHGHQAGDRALESLGELLREQLREVDIIGRLGGEEFAALLPQTDHFTALQVAERLRACTEALELSGANGAKLPLTVSIGLASRHPAEPLEGVMARADAALYKAKAHGRNRVERAMT
jgi:diguanylate cyclase (GGDEF)-like protein